MRKKRNMTEIGKVLSKVERGLQEDLAKRRLIAKSKFSRWRHGKEVKPEDFLRLYRAIEDSALRDALLAAQIADHLPRELQPVVKVAVLGRELPGVSRDELDATAAAVPAALRATALAALKAILVVIKNESARTRKGPSHK